MTPGRRAVRYALSAVVAGVALYASFRGISHDALAHAMHSARDGWVVAALASVLVTLSIVTARSGLLLGAGVGRHWAQLWSAVVIGQAVNIVFPLRFGEAARVASMARRTGWPVGRVVMALALERVCDVAALSAMVLLLIASGRLPPRFAGALPGMLLVILILLAAGVALAFLPVPWVQRHVVTAREAWRAVMHGPRVAGVLALTALGLASSASSNYLVFRAFDLPVPPVAALVLLAVLQVGLAVVSVPGNVGVFQYLTVLTLASWQIDESRALAVAILLHVVTLGPRVALGALAALLAKKHNVKDVKA